MVMPKPGLRGSGGWDARLYKECSVPAIPKEQVFSMLRAEAKWFHPKFQTYLEERYPVWEQFVSICDADLADTSIRRYGGRMVAERIRYLRKTEHNDLVHDHYVPDLTRLYVLFRPHYLNKFDFRRHQNFPNHVVKHYWNKAV